MKPIKLVTGLLLSLASFSAHAVGYEMSIWKNKITQKILVLVHEVHIDWKNNANSNKQQDELIEIMKKFDGVCIAEDYRFYEGTDEKVKEHLTKPTRVYQQDPSISEIPANFILIDHLSNDKIVPSHNNNKTDEYRINLGGMLLEIGNKCRKNSIPFYNADIRNEIDPYVPMTFNSSRTEKNKFKAIAKLKVQEIQSLNPDKRLDQAYSNIINHEMKKVNRFVNTDNIIKEKLSRPLSEIIFCNGFVDLCTMNTISMLQDQNIFVVAGGHHIKNIEKNLLPLSAYEKIKTIKNPYGDSIDISFLKYLLFKLPYNPLKIKFDVPIPVLNIKKIFEKLEADEQKEVSDQPQNITAKL